MYTYVYILLLLLLVLLLHLPSHISGVGGNVLKKRLRPSLGVPKIKKSETLVKLYSFLTSCRCVIGNNK
jgi:hypothetical protein